MLPHISEADPTAFVQLPGPWRNRIVGQGHEAPDQLLANPRNVRIHPSAQQAALLDVLRSVGLVQDVIVNRQTGCVVDGHLRVQLAISDGVPTIPVKYVDLDDDEELLVLGTFDPLSALAAYDRELLAENAADVLGTMQSRGLATLSAFYEELVAAHPPAALPFGGTSEDEETVGHDPNLDTGPTGAEGIVEPSDEDASAPASPAHVKMLSLFFTTETYPVFLARVSTLMASWNLDNPTDAIDRAVREAWEAVPAQEVGDGQESEEDEQ